MTGIVPTTRSKTTTPGPAGTRRLARRRPAVIPPELAWMMAEYPLAHSDGQASAMLHSLPLEPRVPPDNIRGYVYGRSTRTRLE